MGPTAIAVQKVIDTERSQALLPKRKLKNLPHVRKAGVHLAPERCGPSKARKDRTQIQSAHSMWNAQATENLHDEARVNERSRVRDSIVPIRIARPSYVERPQDRRDPDEERLVRKVHPDADPASSARY